MREDATSSENVLHEIKEIGQFENLPPKVPRTNVPEWRTPEDQDEKTGSSHIKIPYLDRRDDDLKMTQMKGAKCRMPR
jgi:hypothetical protein